MNSCFSIGLLLLFALTSCTKPDNDPLKNLNACKQEFINEILKQSSNESPFHMSYSLTTTLFSDNVISLFGQISIYDHLPHERKRYEGLTFFKTQGKLVSISLQELFSTSIEKEWLRNYCEQFLKTDAIASSYFSGKTPLLTCLDYNLIHAFILEPEALCVIFQPYTVAGMTDSPPVIKIPYEKLKVHWNPSNPLVKHVPFTPITGSWPEIAGEPDELAANQKF
jgi:hypothetical protein